MPGPLPRRAVLGAELPGDDEAFGGGGVRIAQALPGGMAARAGVLPGDRLVSLAGAPTRNRCELDAALRRAGARPEAELVLERGGATVTARVAVEVVPDEALAAAAVERGELAVPGARLRTLVTRAPAPRALVLVIQGIACESIDHALSPDAPLAGLVAGWAEGRIDTLRFDKRGIGDSEGGPCPDVDFTTELADARAALALAAACADERGVPLLVYGHSVGGIIAAQLAPTSPIAGVIVLGTPVMRWLDCLADSTRRQLTLRGAPEAEIAARIAALGELERAGELNGRSAAYHAQLHALDLEAAWRAVAVPVLVLRGEHDWVVRADDQARIAELARGPVAVVDLPGLDHLGGRHADRAASLRDYGAGPFDPAIVTATVAWIERTIGAR